MIIIITTVEIIIIAMMTYVIHLFSLEYDIFIMVNHLWCIIISIIIITIIIIFIPIITLMQNTTLSPMQITYIILKIKNIFINKYFTLILDRCKFYILKWQCSLNGCSVLFINVMEHTLQLNF